MRSIQLKASELPRERFLPEPSIEFVAVDELGEFTKEQYDAILELLNKRRARE